MIDWLHLSWGKRNVDDLDGFESSLEAAFQPVEPSPEFVRDLHRRLVSFPVPVTPASDSRVPLYIALTIASLLSGVAIVGFGVWIILALMGKLQSHEKKVTSSPELAL